MDNIKIDEEVERYIEDHWLSGEGYDTKDIDAVRITAKHFISKNHESKSDCRKENKSIDLEKIFNDEYNAYAEIEYLIGRKALKQNMPTMNQEKFIEVVEKILCFNYL